MRPKNLVLWPLLIATCLSVDGISGTLNSEEDTSKLDTHGPVRTVIIRDNGNEWQIPERDIILQETQWVNEQGPAKPTRPKGMLKLGHCKQSSTAWKGVCYRAIDGNVNQHYWKHSCTHTNNEKGWWQARTKHRAHIKKIRIYNRLDCCSNRLRNFEITVDGHRCASYHSKIAFSVKTFHCNRVGRVIRIRTTKRVPLTLCEVQVFGKIDKR